MTTPSLCSNCGKPLPSSAPKGLCPECLMKAGFPTGGVEPTYVPPSIAELAGDFPELEILEMIGRGGMGVVYKARQRELGRLVALKILPDGKKRDPAFAERFSREARALAALNHPNIVSIYDFGQKAGLFYFIMEYVDGLNLRQLLTSSKMAPAEALAIVPQICDALQYAHNQGIVHRDIKPENILLDKNGKVKIADFGLAKITGQPTPDFGLTVSGEVMGTPHYMAPEQVEKPQEVDHRADIYSLGVVFYQMLTGELPMGHFAPPSRKVQIDVRLDEVVLRALEKEPALRYQQANEVKTRVETIAATRSAPGIPDPSPLSTRTEPGRPTARANRYWVPVLRWLLIAFSVFVLAVLCGWFITELLPKIYIATAQIQVLPRGSTNQPGTTSSFDPTDFQAEFEIMQSPDVLSPMIKDLGLNKAWARRGLIPKRDQPSDQDALIYMSRILNLDFVRGTNIINITASSEVPKEAADIANALADRYKSRREILVDQRIKAEAGSLRNQIAEQQKVIDDKKAAVEKIRQDLEQKGIGIPPSAGDQGTTDLDSLKKDLLSAQEDSDARRVLLDSVIKLPDDKFLSTLDGLGRSQPDIIALRAEVSKMEGNIANLLSDGFTEYHPRIVSLRAELKTKQGQLADQIAGVRRAMNVDADMAKSRVVLLQKRVDDLTATLSDHNPSLQLFRDAQRQLESQQKIVEVLNVRLQQHIADSRFQESPVRIIARAEPPAYPAKPNKTLDFVISIIVGFFLSIVVASLVELALWFSSSTPETRILRDSSKPLNESPMFRESGPKPQAEAPSSSHPTPVASASHVPGALVFALIVLGLMVLLKFMTVFVAGPTALLGAVLSALLLLGLAYRQKWAYFVTMAYPVYSILAMAHANYLGGMAVLFLDALVCVPVFLCTDWFFPKNEKNRSIWLWSTVGAAVLAGIFAFILPPKGHGSIQEIAAQNRPQAGMDQDVGGEFRKVSSQTFPLNADGRFSLDAVNGLIEIHGSNSNAVVVDAVVHGRTSGSVDAVKINIDSQTDRVAVHTKLPSSTIRFSWTWPWFENDDVRVDYTVQVPQHARLADITSVNGRIAIDGIAGDIAASTVNGETQIKDAAGNLKLSTVNGRITANMNLLGAGQSVSLDAVNGQVDLALPDTADVNFSVNTVNGGITSDFPSLQPKKEFPVGSSLNGKLGNGSATVKATTVNGTIKILKNQAAK